MKIEIRLEQAGGQFVPILFFPDEIGQDKKIDAYTFRNGHRTASRAFMRECKKPSSETEYLACFQVLKRYISHCEAFMKR